jgi:hypothetical protein
VKCGNLVSAHHPTNLEGVLVRSIQHVWLYTSLNDLAAVAKLQSPAGGGHGSVPSKNEAMTSRFPTQNHPKLDNFSLETNGFGDSPF